MPTLLADVELMLIGWFRIVLPDSHAVTELPDDISEGAFIWVSRIGGNDDLPGIDAANVDIDYLDSTWGSASLLARQAHAALRTQLPGYSNGEGIVSKVETLAAPAWRPYDNTNIRRFGGTYRITVQAL